MVANKMPENNEANREKLALAVFDSMDMQNLEDFVVEHLDAAYQKDVESFDADWAFYKPE
jgi:hypothetical protein